MCAIVHVLALGRWVSGGGEEPLPQHRHHLGSQARRVEGDGHLPRHVSHHPAPDRDHRVGVEPELALDPARWRAPPRRARARSEPVLLTSMRGCVVRRRRPAGARKPRRAPALLVIAHQRGAFRLDRGHRGPLVSGEDGEPGAIDPPDPASDRDAPAAPELDRTGDGLVRLPRACGGGGLYPESSGAEVAHGASQAIELQEAGGRPPILGARRRSAIQQSLAAPYPCHQIVSAYLSSLDTYPRARPASTTFLPGPCPAHSPVSACWTSPGCSPARSAPWRSATSAPT
jgi:hypothetical protein